MFFGLMINDSNAQQNLPIFREFNNLKNHLTKIWNLVQKFNNEKAKQLMIEAKSHMDLAEDYIYRRNDLRWKERAVRARIEMAKARNLGNQAAKIVLRQPINRLKAELDDMINRADIEITRFLNDDARYLINQAKKFRKNAYDALALGQIEKAQELYRIAFFFANKAIDVVNKKETDIDSQINDLKANLNMLINQTEADISESENKRFQNLLQEAKKYLNEADQIYNSGNKQLAFRRYRLIEKLLYRIIDQQDRNSLSSKDKIENDLYSLRSFLDALEPEVQEVSDSRVKNLLERSQKLLKEAKQLFESGQFDKAKSKILLSQRIGSTILRQISTSDADDMPDIEVKLQNAANLLELQAKAVNESEDKTLIKMHSQAENLLNKAQKNLDNNSRETSFQLLQIATRLTNRIQIILDNKFNQEIMTKNELERQLNRVKILLRKLENNSELFEKNENVMIQLNQFAVEAEKYLNEPDYVLAEEYIKTLQQQLNFYTNKWSKKTK